MRVKTTKIGRQRHNSVPARSKSKGAEWQGVFVDFSKFLIVIILAVSLIGVYAYISSSIQRTAAENTKLEREIANINKEIENHQAKIETLKSAENINKQIARFGMDLHLPDSRQRYEITLQLRGNEANMLTPGREIGSKGQQSKIISAREVALK